MSDKKVVVSRRVGDRKIYTTVSVGEDGSPTIEMSLDDFRALLLQEIPVMLNDLVNKSGSMWNVWTQATTEARIRDAWAKCEPEQRIIRRFDEIVEQMKADTVPLARYVR